MKFFIYFIFMFISTCHAKLKVVTSFSILENVVREIAHDRIDIKNIVGANQDAHIFEPTPHTNRLIIDADIIFINGLNFESWFEKLIKASNYQKKVVDLSQHIIAVCAHKSVKHNCIPDPHVWMNVKNVRIWVQEILVTLTEADPHNKTYYQKNAEKYLIKLDHLDKKIQKYFTRLTDSNIKVVTAHDAFNYYEHAYGLKFLSPQGLSTQDEPSAREVAEIIKLIKREKIPAIFIENITSSHLINQIAADAKIKVGGLLYSDALSLPHEPAATYIDLMMYNTKTIFDSLQ